MISLPKPPALYFTLLLATLLSTACIRNKQPEISEQANATPLVQTPTQQATESLSPTPPAKTDVTATSKATTCESKLDTPKVSAAFQTQIQTELTKESASWKDKTAKVFALFTASGWVDGGQFIIIHFSNSTTAEMRYYKTAKSGQVKSNLTAAQWTVFEQEFAVKTTKLKPLCRVIFDAYRYEVVTYEFNVQGQLQPTFRIYMDAPSIEPKQPDHVAAIENFYNLLPKSR